MHEGLYLKVGILSEPPVPNKPTVSVDVKQHFSFSQSPLPLPPPPYPLPPFSPHGFYGRQAPRLLRAHDSRRDQEGGELDSHEEASPEEIKRRKVPESDARSVIKALLIIRKPLHKSNPCEREAIQVIYYSDLL